MKKRKGTIHSVDPVLFQRYLNSQEDHVLATLLCQWAFQPGLKFKSSHLWKHFIKWQKTDNTIVEFSTLEKRLKDEFVDDLPTFEEIKLEESEKMEHDSDYDPYESQG